MLKASYKLVLPIILHTHLKLEFEWSTPLIF